MKMLGELQSPCSTEECRFGFAISNLGDVDKDGKEDFAVGAPYEDDGSGAIFVYYGKNINDGDFGRFQKLGSSEARLKGLNLKGFGYSISKEVVDVDNNQFNDLAVGAPFSDKAVLLKSRPVIRFDDTEPIVAIDPDPVDPQSGQFDIRLDINLNKSDSLFLLKTNQEPIKARIQVELKDDRVNVNPQDRERTIDITTSEKEETFTFTSSNNFGVTEHDTDEPKPIKINFLIQFELNCEPSLDCPVFDQNMKLNHSLTSIVELFSGCTSDVCQCNLNFSLDKQPGSKVIVGKTQSINLAFKVTNQGTEPAFGATIVFESKIDFSLIQGPRGLCTDLDRQGQLFRTECNLRKVKANDETLPTFNFNLPKNFTGTTDFTIQATLKDNCNGMQNEKNLDEELDFELVYQTDFKVSSVVSKSQIM